MNERTFAKLYSERLRGLDAFVSLDDSWPTATRKVHPKDIAGLVTRQMTLFSVLDSVIK